jgi:hypothetical protein
MLRYRALVLALLLALLPSSLRAQQPVTFTVSGFGGVLIPTADLYDEVFPDGAVNFSHKASFAIGGRFGIWATSRIGIEAEAMYLSSDVEVSGLIVIPEQPVFQVDETRDATAFMGSISLLYALIRPPLEPLALFVSGGVGFVVRGGEFFDDAFEGRGFDDTSDIAGVFGIGIRYGVARGVWLRADVKDYLSSFKEEQLQSDSQLQNDILITAGIELSFGGS